MLNFTFTMQLDYIATTQFMWYGGGWIPRQVVFAGLYLNDHYSLQPTEKSLKIFSCADVRKNLRLPNDPFDSVPVLGTTIEVPHDKLKDYISKKFVKKIQNDSGWDVHIGTLDMSTFMFLEPLFPKNTVHFIGVDCVKDHLHLISDAGQIALMAAKSHEKNKWKIV